MIVEFFFFFLSFQYLLFSDNSLFQFCQEARMVHELARINSILSTYDNINRIPSSEYDRKI